MKHKEAQVSSAEQILFEFADGIANARNESEQLSLAFKAFDSEGAELVETMKEGAAGLREFFNEAEALGFILTQQSISGVEAFADEFNRLQKVVGGVINQFTAALAPTLQDITEQFRKFIGLKIDEAGGLEEFGKFLKDEFIDILVSITKVLQVVINFFVQLGNALVLLTKKAGDFFDLNLFPAIGEDAKKAEQELEKFKSTLEELDTFGSPTRTITVFNAEEFLDSLKDLGFEVDDFIKRYDQLNVFERANLLPGSELQRLFYEVTQFVNDIENRLLKEATEMPFSTVDFTSFIDMLLGNKEDNKKAAEDMVDEIEEVVVKGQSKVGETLLGKIFGVGPVTDFWERWYDAGENALERFGAVASLVLGDELIDKIKDGFANSDVGDFTKTLAEGLVKGVEMFEDTLADAIVKGKADFDDLAAHLRQVLAKAIVQKFITGPIMALFGLAKGGPAKAGQPYIVGEEGPELFVPKQSGTVMPNHMLGNMAGGPAFQGGTSQNITINAVDTQSFQQALARDPEFLFAVTQQGAKSLPRS